MKTNLPDTDVYAYVIETNLIQRFFSDLKISEKAAVLKERYLCRLTLCAVRDPAADTARQKRAYSECLLSYR